MGPIRATLGHAFALLATGQLGQFQTYLRSLGPWAPLVSIALAVLAALAIPVPLTIVMIANGLVFGVWGGALVSLVGSLAGAMAAYAIGRALGRSVLERWLPKASLEAADHVSHRYGAWAVVLERWIPGVPGDPMSYAAGFTRMPLLRFLGWTTVGLVPGNLVTAYAGSEIPGDVPLRYWLTGVALVLAGWSGWAWRQRRRRRLTSAS